MKLIAPDYYRFFRCIASDCRHSCCVGWEIDIDDDSLERYRRADGGIGERLRASIEEGEGGAHFVLGQDERCPFLNDEGLCDLIIGMGEDSLCEICADHPRFRNFLSDRTEIGLGLCCEAAGRLILERKAKTGLVVLEDDGEEEALWEEEAEVLGLREAVFDILQDRTLPVGERLGRMTSLFGIEDAVPEWTELKKVLSGLERLDPAWDECIRRLDVNAPAAPLAGEMWETAFEQLAVYFAYRHLIPAAEDGNIPGRAGFIALSVRVIRRICEVLAAENGAFAIEDLVDVARMYSSEIEYSDENLDALIALYSDGE